MAPANGGDILSNHPNKKEIINRMRQTLIGKMAALTPEERKNKFGRVGPTNPNWRNGGTSSKMCPVCGRTKISSTANVCLGCMDRTKENNPFYGRHHSEETKKLLREKNLGDNSWIKGIDPALLPYTNYYTIVYPSGKSKQVAGLKAIAKEFNVTIENVHATIKRIAAGKLPQRGVFANIIILKNHKTTV